ncbi:MAG: chaperone modulator CbpM [Aquincola sp.]|nr:chaperone modulator CbpM [Aquincola sp.]
MNSSTISIGVCVAGEHALELEEFAAACGIEVSFVRVLVEEGLLAPAVERPAWRFGGEELARVRRICRLQRDFEANLQSVAVMLDLIDEIERLRAQLHRTGIAAS